MRSPTTLESLTKSRWKTISQLCWKTFRAPAQTIEYRYKTTTCRVSTLDCRVDYGYFTTFAWYFCISLHILISFSFHSIVSVWNCECSTLVHKIGLGVGPGAQNLQLRNGAIIWPRLLWRTNRKSHMHFRLVTKSMTLDDLEPPERHSCRNKIVLRSPP